MQIDVYSDGKLKIFNLMWDHKLGFERDAY